MKLRGLIKKDVLLICTQMKFFLIVTLGFLLLAAFGSIPYYQGFAILFASMLPVSALTYDEQSKWSVYAIAMGYQRRDVVLSKYALSLILLLSFFLFYLAARAIFTLSKFSLAVEMQSLSMFAAIGLLYAALVYPFAFLLGTAKARLANIMGLAIGFGALTAIGVNDGEMLDLVVANHMNLQQMFLPVALILFFISGFVSLTGYEKRRL